MPSETETKTPDDGLEGFDRLFKLVDAYGCSYKRYQLMAIPGTSRIIASLGSNKRVICSRSGDCVLLNFRRSNVLDRLTVTLENNADPAVTLEAILYVCEQYDLASDASPAAPLTSLELPN